MGPDGPASAAWYAPRPYGVGTQVRLGSLSYPLQIVESVSYTYFQYLYGLYRHAHIFPTNSGGANSREPFEKPESQHGERRCRLISPCAALRDGRHDDRRFPFL
jgi:hypothetical protein